MRKIEFRGNTAEIINHLFQVILVTYLALLLVEQVWPGVVSTYLNLNYLLVVVIIVGILDVFSEHPEHENHKKPTKLDYVFIFALGILGFAILKYKTSELGWLSWVISIIAGILIILLSILVLEEDSEDDNDKLASSRKTFELTRKNIIWIIILSALVLALISTLLGLFSPLSYPESFRVVFGFVYVLFLPGFVLSYLFFPKTISFDANSDKESAKLTDNLDKAIDWLERIALSFALSIAVVPLAVFYLNLIGIKINFINSFFTILGIIVLSLIGVYIRYIKIRRDK